jgi:hypothetical protein
VNDNTILGQVALGYSPFIDRTRAVTATRLTVFPLHPEATPDVAQLLHAVGGVWPASGGRASLNVLSESLLHDLMNAAPSPNLMVEVPAFMAVDPANIIPLQNLHAAGTVLLIKGRPLREGETRAQSLAVRAATWAAHWERTGQDPQYIPYPATWLNRGDYETPPPRPLTSVPVRRDPDVNGGLGGGTSAERANAFLSLRGTRGPNGERLDGRTTG